MKTQNKGFTLIELLVVIAIISLLSSIAISSFRDARLKAEDARILQEITSFQQGVALFLSEYGRYPNPIQPIASGLNANSTTECADGICDTTNDDTQNLNTNNQESNLSENVAATALPISPYTRCVTGTCKLINATIYNIDSSNQDFINLKRFVEYENIVIPLIAIDGKESGGGIIYKYYPDTQYGEVIFVTNEPERKGTTLGEIENYRKQDAANPYAGGY